MYGYLVPSSGGEAIALPKTRLFLGRAKGADAPLSRDNAYCQLELIEGFWHLEDLSTPQGVKVNGRACKRQRLMPDDEITIGKHRYRITFEPPKYSGVGRLAKTYRPPGEKSVGAADRTVVMASRTAPPVGGILGRLVPVGGGREIPLTKSRVLIGRRPPCDVILDYRSISAMHCGLELLNGYWQARDLDSRNGIRVEGVAVKKAWVLPKCRLALAEHRFQVDYVGVGPPPADSLADEREQQTVADKRSLMDKVGLSGEELERVARKKKDDTEERRRWNVFDNG